MGNPVQQGAGGTTATTGSVPQRTAQPAAGLPGGNSVTAPAPAGGGVDSIITGMAGSGAKPPAPAMAGPGGAASKGAMGGAGSKQAMLNGLAPDAQKMQMMQKAKMAAAGAGGGAPGGISPPGANLMAGLMGG